IDEIVELNLDRTDKALKVGTVAQLSFLGNDLRVDAAERGGTLAAQGSELDFDALLLEFLEASQNQPQDVGVQAAAQAFVCRHDDHTRGTNIALDHVWVLVVRMRVHEIGRDIPNFGGVWASSAHAILRFAHLGCRHHLHGFGDLSRVLHALDLVTNFLDSGHCCFLRRRCGRRYLVPARQLGGKPGGFPAIASLGQKAPCFLNSWIADASSASSSLDSSFFSWIRLTRASCLDLSCSFKAFSKLRI